MRFDPSMWGKIMNISRVVLIMPSLLLTFWGLREDKDRVNIIIFLWGSLVVGALAIGGVARGIYKGEFVVLSLFVALPFVWNVLCRPSERLSRFLKKRCRKIVLIDLWGAFFVYLTFVIVSLILFIMREYGINKLTPVLPTTIVKIYK